jgi:hypothetical protein
MNRVAREMNDGIAAIGSEPRKHRICDSRRDGAAGISEDLAPARALLPSSRAVRNGYSMPSVMN